MTFALVQHGRTLARGTRSHILDVGEELGVIRRDTLGHDTAEPVHVPRIVERGVVVRVVAGRRA